MLSKPGPAFSPALGSSSAVSTSSLTIYQRISQSTIAWSLLMSRCTASLTRSSALLENPPSNMRFIKQWTTSSSMPLLWRAMVTIRRTRCPRCVGICAQRRAALSRANRAKPSRWCSTSVNSTTSRSWVLTSPYSKLNRNVKTFTFLPSCVCWSVFPRRCVRTRKLWLLCASLSSRSLMTVFALFASWTIWSPTQRRLSSGVSRSPCSPIVLKLKCLSVPKFMSRPTSKLRRVATRTLVRLISTQMVLLLAFWTILTTLTLWFTSLKCSNALPSSASRETSTTPTTSMISSTTCLLRRVLKSRWSSPMCALSLTKLPTTRKCFLRALHSQSKTTTIKKFCPSLWTVVVRSSTRSSSSLLSCLTRRTTRTSIHSWRTRSIVIPLSFRNSLLTALSRRTMTAFSLTSSVRWTPNLVVISGACNSAQKSPIAPC